MGKEARMKGLFSYVKNGRVDAEGINDLMSMGQRLELHELFYKDKTGNPLYHYITQNTHNSQLLLNKLFDENFKEKKSSKSIKYSPDKLHGRSFLYWAIMLNQYQVVLRIIEQKDFELKDFLEKDDLNVELLTRINNLQNSVSINPLIFAKHFSLKKEKYTPQTLYRKTIGYWAFRLHQFDIIKDLIDKGQFDLSELFYMNEHNKNLLTRMRMLPNSDSMLEELFHQSFKIKDGTYVRVVNAKDDNTVLQWAVILGQHNIVKELLASEKHDVNAENNEGLTALHFAAQYSDANMVQLLLSHGANVNAESKSGANPLFLAAHSGNSQVIEALKEAQAKDCELKQTVAQLAPGVRGDNIMMLVTRQGRHDLIEPLSSMAKINHVSSQTGLTPTLVAILEGKAEVLQALIEHEASLHFVAKNGMNVWIAAAIAGNENIYKVLIASEAPANLSLSTTIEDLGLNKGETALHVAAKLNNLILARILLVNLKVIANVKDAKGQTPLHLAASKGHEDMIDLLMDNGANINQTDKSGITPLMRAAQNVQISLVHQLLITYQAKPNLQVISSDEDGIVAGDTAAHIARRGMKSSVADYLLNNGADASLKNSLGETPNDATKKKWKLHRYFHSKKSSATSAANISSNSSANLFEPEIADISSSNENDKPIGTDDSAYGLRPLCTNWHGSDDEASSSDESTSEPSNLATLNDVKPSEDKSSTTDTAYSFANGYEKIAFSTNMSSLQEPDPSHTSQPVTVVK